MTNILGVCLFSLLCFSGIASARQLPKECSKGPSYWCQSLKVAADCGAVGHCIGTVWEKQEQEVRRNDVSEKFIHLFRDLKDIRELINAEYLAARLNTACRDVADKAVTKYCRENTAYLEQYIAALLASDASAETMCRVVSMCNSDKLDHITSMNKKKSVIPDKHEGKLLGSSHCTWGPSYWCGNFSTSRECKAIHHCVSRVWPRTEFPHDNDGICKICTDMVQQARDQLQSNETQEELKEVFEGSCKLIPIKLVRKECITLADDFVPELVETLASQMNPQAVCSVAGLCNSARIDAMLEDYNKKMEIRSGCNNCRRTVGVLRKRFDATSYEDFLLGLMRMCGHMGSLSDSCSMLVFKYYENILAATKKDLTSASICHLSGQCAQKYHSHDEYDFPEVKLDQLKATDDVPCEFCEQVVNHLRDVLVANTTEAEFHRVLIGLCKQTGSFKNECLSLVEQYYAEIYNYLVSGLKGQEVCSLMGVCGNRTDVPIVALLPKELAVKASPRSPLAIGTEETTTPANTTPKLGRVPVANKQTNVRIIGAEPADILPIERMFVAVPQNKELCAFCQYFLHYLQVELSDTKTEDAITTAVNKACEVLPESVNGQCKQFVTEFGPAVIALLVQEIDPSSVCPAIGLCPQTEEVRRVSINADKSNCPLCLFAVEQLETMLKNNRSEENIRHALDGLCSHLSARLRTECVDFVDAYTNQLVEMLVANMNAQEICVFLKLCEDKVNDPLKITRQTIETYHENPQLRGDRNNHRGKSLLPTNMLENQDGDIMTNEIPDHTRNGRPKKHMKQKTACVVCEFVMKEIDDQIKDKHNDDEIKKIVHGVCRRMPKSVRGECDQFVEKYADLVISLLAQELDPSEVCQELKLCDPSRTIAAVREAVLDCAVCETVVMAVKKVLSNEHIDHDIVHVVEKSCALLPAKYSDRCHTLMEIYGDSIIHLIEDIGTKGVCEKIGLCSDHSAAYVHMHKAKN